MAKQIIDIGTSANKGDGDPLRTAFRKINENFNELYTANGNVSGAVADVLPSTDSTYDLGSAAKQWADLHVADFIYLNGARIEITAGGALLVNGGAPTEVQDVQGSVFGDDSTTLVDSVNNVINLDGTISGDVVPDANEAYDLGSATNRFRDLYLSGSTIDLGGTTLSVVGGALQIDGTDISEVVASAGLTGQESATGDGGEIRITGGTSTDTENFGFGGNVEIQAGENPNAIQQDGGINIGTDHTNGVVIGAYDFGN